MVAIGRRRPSVLWEEVGRLVRGDRAASPRDYFSLCEGAVGAVFVVRARVVGEAAV